jgi:aminoglycoside phosphotransferase
MLQNIFNILEVVKGETENIRIAQGKYYLPNTIKDNFKQFKKEMQWLKNTQ